MSVNLNFLFAITTAALLFLSSCATKTRFSEPHDEVAVEEVSEDIVHPSLEEEEAVTLSEVDEFNDYNRNVQIWIDYFAGRGRKVMRLYLQRSGKYLPAMKKIFREKGLPEDLTYVAMIESGFSPRAVSHASAVGYWQFIAGTAKRYGLENTYYVDDRRDPYLATEAAAKYLKALYTVFGSWHLAMASYNTGENRVKRAIMKHFSRDYWKLVEKRALPRETRNYVGKFLAALRISKNPEKYGFQGIRYDDPIAVDIVEARHAVSLRKMSKKMGISLSKLRSYNMRYKTDVAPLRKGRALINVPAGMKSIATVAAAESKWSGRIPAGSVYIVRRGDTLSTIAQRTGTSLRGLMAANGLSKRSLIRPGQRLRLSGAKRNTAKKSSGKNLRQPGTKSKKIHIVRRGDTLSTIAQRYRVSMNELTKVNGIRSRSKIFVGSHLVIPD